MNDNERLEQLAEDLRNHSGGVMDGCILALDGLGVIAHCPFKDDMERQRDYHFHKGCFAIVALAGFDVDGRFICATTHHSGNNIVAWNDSELHYFLEVMQGLPSKYFFIGDEAFTDTQQFLSPWPGKGLNHY